MEDEKKIIFEKPPGLIALDEVLREDRGQTKKAQPLHRRVMVRKKPKTKKQRQKDYLPTTMETFLRGAGPSSSTLKHNETEERPTLKATVDTFLFGAGPSKTKYGEMRENKEKEWEETGEKQYLKEENERKDKMIQELQDQKNKEIQELQDQKATFSTLSPASSDFQPRDEDIGAPMDNLAEEMELEHVQRTINIIQGSLNAAFQQKLLDKMMEDYMCLSPGYTRQKTLMEEFLQGFNVPTQSKSSLKLSYQTLPQFSGKECDYFDWKTSVQEILACTSTPAAANLVAVKNSCFKDCGNGVKNCVKTVQSLPMLFEVLDARFGSKTAHATRISKEISSLKSITSGNYQSIISFVENFENSKRMAINSNISECFVNLPIYVELSNKLSPELLDEYLIQFPNEDISVECKMQNMQEFLSKIKHRAIKAKSLRYNDDSKTHRLAKVNVVSVNNEMHASKKAEGGGAVNALKINPSPVKRMAKWSKRGARMAKGTILSAAKPFSVCCVMKTHTQHLHQFVRFLENWKESMLHNLKKRVYV